MRLQLDRVTAAASAALLLAALVACKKDEEKKPEPLASATLAEAPAASASAPTPQATADAAQDAGAEAGQDAGVKRYEEDEQPQSGTVKVVVASLPVYPEADATSEELATVPRGTLVNLKARYSDYYLIAYPTGPGELGLGWIEQKINNQAPISARIKWDAGAEPRRADAGTADAGATQPRSPGRRRRRR
jgi:hypothetical protein